MRVLCRAATAMVFLVLAGCNSQANPQSESLSGKTAIATFAGGCFWCMEPPFDKIDGVISTISGYSGGRTKNPDYKEVSSGRTGHAEVLQVVYDPLKVSYEQLLEVFWHNVDPTRSDGQFCDGGNQYRPAIYYHDENQLLAAKESKANIEKTKTFAETIKVEITKASKFYAAEDYHQDYYLKNPVRYKYYRYSCGRDDRLKALWGDRKT
ncbi:MAG: peptide-methionine (S)-S-oxide reductase [Gammaproteobacteria bacterium]|jgi:peptide-methionine (S)-S-oxide reductase